MREEKDLYKSGLQRSDWHRIASVIDQYLTSQDGGLIPPSQFSTPSFPEQLADHSAVTNLEKYLKTHDPQHLDAAGQSLVPTSDNWFLVVTKR